MKSVRRWVHRISLTVLTLLAFLSGLTCAGMKFGNPISYTCTIGSATNPDKDKCEREDAQPGLVNVSITYTLGVLGEIGLWVLEEPYPQSWIRIDCTFRARTNLWKDQIDFAYGYYGLIADRNSFIADTEEGSLERSLGRPLTTEECQIVAQTDRYWVGISIPPWAGAPMFGAWPLIAFLGGPIRRWRRRRRNLCIHCGYNLTGNTTGRCSECGRETTKAQRHKELKRLEDEDLSGNSEVKQP